MRKFAKREVKKRLNFQGMDLAIEFPKGSKRSFEDDRGRTQYKTMHADYGEIAGTHGLDGDALDVYVGPDKTSDHVFVVTQMKKNDWDKVDEEKCILGVKTIADARALYLKHYDDPRFCGSIKEMPMSDFRERLLARGTVGKKIASVGARIGELNYLRLQQGEDVLVQEGHGVKLAEEDFAVYPAAPSHRGSDDAKRVGKAVISPLGVGAATGGGAAYVTKGMPMKTRAALSALAAVGAHQIVSGTRNQVKKHKRRYDRGKRIEEYEKQSSLIDWTPELDRAYEAQRKYAGAETDPDPKWDSDIPDDVERIMKKKAPDKLEDMRRSAIARVDVNKQEQLGLCCPKNMLSKDPTDSKLRKAAQMAEVEAFLKEAKKEPSGNEVAGSVGGTALGSVGGMMLAHKLLGARGAKHPVAVPAYIAGGLGGGAIGGSLGHHAGKAVEKHQKGHSPMRRTLETMGALGGLAAGAYGARKGIGALVKHRTSSLAKAKMREPLAQNVKDMHEFKSLVGGWTDLKPNHKGIDKVVARAEGKLKAHDALPLDDFGREATRGELGAAGLGGAAAGGGAGIAGIQAYDRRQKKKKKQKTAAHQEPKKKRTRPGVGAAVGGLVGGYAGHKLFNPSKSVMALMTPRERKLEMATSIIGGLFPGVAIGHGTEHLIRNRKKKQKTASKLTSRAGRLSDRLDDIGIATLAAPYAAKGVAKTLENLPGWRGEVGKASRKAADWLHHRENRFELAGLALVAPGVTHRLGSSIDKRVPAKAMAKKAMADKYAAGPLGLAQATMPLVKRVGQGIRGMFGGGGRAAAQAVESVAPAKATRALAGGPAQQSNAFLDKIVAGQQSAAKAPAKGLMSPALAPGATAAAPQADPFLNKILAGQQASRAQQVQRELAMVEGIPMPSQTRMMAGRSAGAPMPPLQSAAAPARSAAPAARPAAAPQAAVASPLTAREAQQRALMGNGSSPVAQMTAQRQVQQLAAAPTRAATLPPPAAAARPQTLPPARAGTVPPPAAAPGAIPPPPRMPTNAGAPSQIPAAAGANAPIVPARAATIPPPATIPAPPPAMAAPPARVATVPPPPATAATAAPVPPAAAGTPVPPPAATPAASGSIAPPAAATNMPAPTSTQAASATVAPPANTQAAAAATDAAGQPLAAGANPHLNAEGKYNVVNVKGQRVLAGADGMPLVDAKGNYLQPDATTLQRIGQGVGGAARGIRNTAIFGLGAAGLGVGAAGMAAAGVLGGHPATLNPPPYQG